MMEKSLVVFLTGAGISAESGLKTFRAADGLWEDHSIEEIATPGAFRRDPMKVHDFYNQRRRDLRAAQPNVAHIALGKLEKRLENKFLLITQNIDDLHERGGNQRVVHMHGELFKVFCIACNERREWRTDLTTADPCASCGTRDTLRPDIVWFGEMPYRMDEINHALERCVIFVAVGTSGSVFPAAGFVLQARAAGAIACEINLAPSAVQQHFHRGYYGKATEQLPSFIKDVEAKVLGNHVFEIFKSRK